MADSTPLAGLLDRAGRVFSLAEQLGYAFRDEYDRQGTGHRTVDATAWVRHEAAFNNFCAAVLDLREEIQNSPDGFAPVAQVLMEAAHVAKQIRDTMQTAHGQQWQSFLEFRFHFASIVAKGSEAICAATKAQRLDDPFAFVERPAKKAVGAIDTTPTIPRPPAKLIDAAERSIPVILANVPADSSGQTVLPTAAHLVTRMQNAEHTLAAAQWAIHESVMAGRLEAGRVEVEFPSKMTDSGWIGGGRGTKAIPKDKPAPFDCFKVIPTAAMSAWWQSWESGDQPEAEPAGSTTDALAIDSLPDPFTKLSRFEELRKAADALAAEFWAKRKPFHKALISLSTDALDPERWIKAGEQLRLAELAAFPKEMAASSPVDDLPRPDQVACWTAWALLSAAAIQNHGRVSELVANVRDRPQVKASLDQILIRVQEDCLAKWRIQNSPPYIARLQELMRRLGLSLEKALEWLQAGNTNLQPGAESAMRDWLQSLQIGQPIAMSESILPPSPDLADTGRPPPTIPRAVKNWLAARYLEDPTPEVWRRSPREAPEPLVFVLNTIFTEFLLNSGFDLFPNLDIWKNAGWIDDTYVDVTTSENPEDDLPHCFARLNLPVGKHRLVGIRRAVLDASTEPPPSTAATSASLTTVSTNPEEAKLPADPLHPPGWAGLGEAKRAILTVLGKSTKRLIYREIAKLAGYKPDTVRQHTGALGKWKYIDNNKDGYAITPEGTALLPCKSM